MAESDQQRWDDRYLGQTAANPVVSWLERSEWALPQSGSALDVASGTGRLALWMAKRGLNVTAVDVSPVGLAIAKQSADASGLPLSVQAMDLELGPGSLPNGPFVMITCFHYRQPSLWPLLIDRLAPGGFLIVEIATVINLEQNERPSRRWLAEPGEIRNIAAGLNLVHDSEEWRDGRHLARLVAQATKQDMHKH